jgi:hypothetical protein
MGWLYLTNATDAMNKRGKKADDPVMTNPAKILEQAAGEKVRRIGREARIGATGTGKRKRIRRGQKQAQAGSKGELTGGHGEGRRSGQARKPMAGTGVGSANKGA